MVSEQGIVKTVDADHAYIKVERSEACHSCEAQGACKMLTNKEMIVRARNQLGAKEGDRVEIGLGTGSFLTMTMVVYFVPVLGFVVGAVLGWERAPRHHLDPTLAALGLGIALMAAGFFLARRFDRRFGSSRRYEPVITRILPSRPLLRDDDSK